MGYLKNEVTVMEECCCQKTKVRTDEEYKSLMNRLNRIEGQIRGLKGTTFQVHQYNLKI